MALMARWFRCNPYLGSSYEISEREALRKINSRWWVAVWDDYWQRFSDDSWYDIRDPERSWIFKVEDDEETNIKADERNG